MMGGLGVFFPPLLLTFIYSIAESYSIGFIAFSQFSLVSMVLVLWLHYMDRLSLAKEVFDSTGKGIIVTDKHLKIVSVNPAFTTLTGYVEDEVLGEKPNILSSGKHDKAFYEKMWQQILSRGHWQGEIWNKRKDGEHYLQLLSINTIKDESGEVVRYVGTFSDITHL